jgi:GntR family transcriptional regulator, N-acetylglucosamine utilization regulator
LRKRVRGLPKYWRISQDVIAEIRSGRLKPGDRVPSENELISRYGVSNTTARKAHQELERGGWAVRIKARGTFVQKGAVERSADRILSFTKNMLQAGRRPSTEVLDASVRRRPQSLVLHGRTYTLRGPVCSIERLRRADGVPMMRETRSISLALCPGIDEADLSGSLYDIYESRYGLQLDEVHQMLSAVILEGEQLDWFGLRSAVPAFLVEGVTFCGKELILEMERSVYRGDMYRFLVTAGPNEAGGSQ